MFYIYSDIKHLKMKGKRKDDSGSWGMPVRK